MNRQKLVNWAVIAFAIIGVAVVAAWIVPTPDSGAGQIAVLAILLGIVWLAERVWKSSRSK
jgi:hypothetical protein